MVRWRLHQVWLSGGLLVVSGCAVEPFNPPPRLEQAFFVDGATLRLQFSEPVVPEDGVEPAQFRLSLAVVERSPNDCDYGYYEGDYDYDPYSECQPYHHITRYYDAGSWVGSTVECEDAGYYYECHPVDGQPLSPVVATDLRVVGDDVLELRFSPGIDPTTCAALAGRARSENVDDTGVFVHFTDRDGEEGRQIRDRDGASFGLAGEFWAEPWTLPPGFVGHDDVFPQVNPNLKIPCPG